MAESKQPPGGYRLLPVTQLCAVWTAYLAGELSWLAVRVFLALQEVAARREATERSMRRRGRIYRPYRIVAGEIVGELQQLVGCARLTQVRTALRQLVTTGVLAESDGVLSVDDCKTPGIDVGPMLAQLGRGGRVPVPRRVLRYLALRSSAASAAFLLGAACRCCYLQRGGAYSARGRCSIRFVAEAFELHERSVKRATAELAAQGWVTRPVDNCAWRRRWGGVIELHAVAFDSETSPRAPAHRTGLSPAIEKRKLLTDVKNQERRVVSEDGQVRCLRAVQLRELRDANCLERRFQRVVRSGLLANTPADRLQFHAAAVHALRVGRRNPCGLFVAVIRRGIWAYISQGDEDAARAMLARTERTVVERQRCSPDLKRLQAMVAGVASRVAWPASQPTRNCRNTAATRPKSCAAQCSPQSSASPRMASSASSTASTFSANVAANTARSARSDDCSSDFMSPACHTSPPFSNYDAPADAPSRSTRPPSMYESPPPSRATRAPERRSARTTGRSALPV